MKRLPFYIIILFISGNIFSQSDQTPPSTPKNFKWFAYENHYELTWDKNIEIDLAGYEILKYDGEKFKQYKVVSKSQNYFMEFLNENDTTLVFKLRAYDTSLNRSDSSNAVIVNLMQMDDAQYLDMVQRSTFRYFWDYAHPISGLIRERSNGDDNLVTIGGSGFGVMALLVGIDRDFISREQGKERLLKILDFLENKAQRYHGVFPHWLNGTSGITIPFSTYDNGGDLVETSFLIQGLLTARQYFDGNDSTEENIRNSITRLWEAVEWTFYQKAWFSDYLFWHWSPNYDWRINMKIHGWNETMICYILGIASPTHPIPSKLFYRGFANEASGSSMANGNSYYGHKLFVGPDYGGPMFFSHYSFLGFDPRNKRDKYANYFVQNRNQTLINRAYCIDNPKNHKGYSENSWGLTASDNPDGYKAHEPNYNDDGTISPTAALSSMPYTPEESISALKFFYKEFGSKIYSYYGFRDAFNLNRNWFAQSHLAIDQGPIIVMIENYRSQLLWNNFMKNGEIVAALDSIGFIPDNPTNIEYEEDYNNYFRLIGNYPNPFNPSTTIEFETSNYSEITIKIYDSLGREIRNLFNGAIERGNHKVLWDGTDDAGTKVSSGIYYFSINAHKSRVNGKLLLLK